MDEATRGFYDGDPEGYSEATRWNDVTDLTGRFISRLPPGARILDLGCGSGRDTLAFRHLGFGVVPVDGSEGMCHIASESTGSEVRRLDFLDLDYVDEFDGVWACASLLHLRPEEIPEVMGLVRRALRSGGVFFLSFKEGDFRGYRDGRWYTDMTPEGLRELAEETGFRVFDLWESEDRRRVRWVSGILGLQPS